MALNLKTLHIQVIEDLSPMRELTISVLKTQGVGEVTFSADGNKGFEDFCIRKPDIVITDWQMPEMCGLELVKLIRTSPRSPNKAVPIIMMTGFGSPLRISEARNVGVTEFIMKPFSAHDLNKRILHLIKNPRDFIVTKDFSGPDRRRKDTESYSKDHARTNPKGYLERIPASKYLQSKVGLGSMDENLLDKSQKLLDDNKFNFIPIAKFFLQQLEEAIKIAHSEDGTNRKSVERCVNPVMQIKANARIFKLDLLGNLASIMLHFLDNMNELDDDALKIVEAHHRTLNHILNTNMLGDGGDTGKAFETELENACQRYVNSRIARQKAKLQETLLAKSG